METLCLSQVSIHGATMATLLQNLMCAGRNVDGILLGRVQTQITSHLQDSDSGMVTIEDHQVSITGVLCSISSCSFYDVAGEINEAALQGLLPPHHQHEPLIGWLSYRAGAGAPLNLQPSMREAAVTTNLYAREAMTLASRQKQHPTPGVRLPPVLLLLVSSCRDHCGATVNMDYRAFQASNSSPNQVLQCMSGHLPQEPIGLQPIKVAIENLAGRKESGYKFSPLDQPHLMLPGGMSTTTAGEGQRLEGVLEAAAEAAGRQVAAVESHCDDILRQIKAMCHKVAGGASESAALRAENERLLRELEELQV